MIVSIRAQPENVSTDPMAGEALDSRLIEQLRDQISYSIAIATQDGEQLTSHEFHVVIGQQGGRHDWALFGASFTQPGSSDLYSGDEPTQQSALAAAMRQAILLS